MPAQTPLFAVEVKKELAKNNPRWVVFPLRRSQKVICQIHHLALKMGHLYTAGYCGTDHDPIRLMPAAIVGIPVPRRLGTCEIGVG